MSASTSPDLFHPPCSSINGVTLDWSGRGTSHVEFHKSDALPLVQGRFLGYGIHGGVYETSCNGVTLAWKRKFCRQKIGPGERKEIEIIKSLSHQHVIKIVGTYTHGPFLGLLLWPVATCDLASFIEDVDWLQKEGAGSDLRSRNPPTVGSPSEQDVDRSSRLESLGICNSPLETSIRMAVAHLEKTIGCIAGAVAYLHRRGIKHKDLKPSNILLSRDGLWVTDFGTATDFSLLTKSATENGERGTPKYFAPEVAEYMPSGRSADIFSMGCIFLEIVTLCAGYTLEPTQRLREQGDKSYHANIDAIIDWFDTHHNLARTPADEHLMGLARSMMEPNPADRPNADMVEEDVALISGLATASGGFPFRGSCCDPRMLEDEGASAPITFQRQITIVIGNTYRMLNKRRNHHTYTFFVAPSRTDIVTKVHVFVHQSFRKSHLIINRPPFEFHGRGYGSFDISVYIVLPPGYYWDHPNARAVPGEKENRMLALFWELNFDRPQTQITHKVSIKSKVWS